MFAFGFPGGEIPPEMQEEMDRQEMDAQERSHSLMTWLENLGAEDLRNVRTMLMQSDHIQYVQLGVIATLLSMKHGVCLACGKDHAEDLGLHTEGAKSEYDDSETRGAPGTPAWERLDSKQTTSHLPEEIQNALKVYEVAPVSFQWPKVVCINCKETEYPSLDDRMLSKPGKPGCPVCTHKEKWG